MINDINAFLFRGKIDNKNSRICVCLRKDDAWDETSVFYIDATYEEAEKRLTANHFNIMFANYTIDKNDPDKFFIEQFQYLTMEDPSVTIPELYKDKKFFSKVESGYQKLLNIDD